jgi:hypothetical protein
VSPSNKTYKHDVCIRSTGIGISAGSVTPFGVSEYDVEVDRKEEEVDPIDPAKQSTSII